jgi:hypothetical protein
MERVGDLTVAELRELMHTVVEEVLEERLGMLTDPDEGLELRPEVVQSLEAFLAGNQRGKKADEVFESLGLGYED